MKYTYDLILHNAAEIPITKAVEISNMLQAYIREGASHIQSVGIDEKPENIRIIIETSYKLDDLFSVVYDNRSTLGYKDFSIYYSEGFDKVVQCGYGA